MSTKPVVVAKGNIGSPKHQSPEHRVTFDIYEFKSLKKIGYYSSLVKCHGYQWKLKLYSWGYSDPAKAKEYTSIYLCCVKASDQEWPIVEFIIRAEDQVGTYETQFTEKGEGWSKCAKRSHILSKLDSSGTLNVHVDIRIKTEKQRIWQPETTLQQKLERLLHDDKNTDVTFMLPGGCHVFAHQLVLKIQSPTLNDFAEEAQDGIVHIERADPDLFAGMVRFMYTNRLPNGFDVKKDGIELLKLANAYGCSDLKMVMEAKIIESDLLSIENAAEMLLLADANDSAQLKEAAMDLVISNPTKTMQTDGWKDLQESHSLVMEAFAKFSKEVEKSKGQIDREDPDLEQLSISALRKLLADAKLDADGTRETLVKRLKEDRGALAAKSN